MLEAEEMLEVLEMSVLLSLSIHCSRHSNCLILVRQLGVLCLNVGGLQHIGEISGLQLVILPQLLVRVGGMGYIF